MNVLVYSGPEILPDSLMNALASLRGILFPHYAVQVVTQSTLTSQPWTTSCALMVLPQYKEAHSGLSPVVNKQIGEFVEVGGKCLKISERHLNPSAEYDFLRGVLRDLGLNIPDNAPSFLPSRPLPQLFTSSHHCSAALLRAIRTIFNLGQDLEGLHKDANDEFQFHSFDRQRALDLLASCKTEDIAGNISKERLKHILVCEHGILPDGQITPLFDLKAYYETLGNIRGDAGLKNSGEPGVWKIGEVLLYGEVVSSTQTMLDKYVFVVFVTFRVYCSFFFRNPCFLSSLPVPLLSLASHQLAGRGRGSNLWLSPPGCLQFSLLLRVQLSCTPTAPAFPTAKLVFIQYLFALAVVEACRDEKVLGERVGSKVRLKWPNDLYADFGTDGKEEFKKVGGVLVNTNFQGGMVDIVIGK